MTVTFKVTVILHNYFFNLNTNAFSDSYTNTSESELLVESARLRSDFPKSLSSSLDGIVTIKYSLAGIGVASL